MSASRDGLHRVRVPAGFGQAAQGVEADAGAGPATRAEPVRVPATRAELYLRTDCADDLQELLLLCGQVEGS